MKQLFQSKASSSTPHGAFALVTVLAVVVVLVVVVVALAQIASSQRRAASIDRTIFNNQALADMAVNIVTAQVRTATTQPNNVAWASQPGLISTFSGQGVMGNAYKLYSTRRMIVDGVEQLDADLTMESSPEGWSARPAVWHDLNAPATVPADDPSEPSTTVFPILDPRALGQVDGFAIEGSTVPVEELPMPVQWMYVLADGNVVAPDPAEGNGRQVQLPGASNANPPVGRIAFWTDDDTCKVNVNTAGYARNDASYWTYWDTPVVSTHDENWSLSAAQPWTHEFQRYPGHPATTGLNGVFEPLDLTEDQILSLTSPFYHAGGTRGGTVRVGIPPTQAENDDLVKADPLFASVDELFYAPDRGLRANGISREDLEMRRFFLTAHSRAPEANLFNMPRVTIWPNWETPGKRSTLDRLIAFCSTIGDQAYYFVRENARASNELAISQNEIIYDYLSALTSKPIPGVGPQTFADKFGSQTRDQVLTSIFDAIRLVNIDDRTGTGRPGEGWSFTAGELRAGNGNLVPVHPLTVNVGYVAPTLGPNNTRSPGRASTLAEVAIQFGRFLESPTIDHTPDPDTGLRPYDSVRAMMLYGFATPAAGTPLPGQNRRIEVSGLSGFRVQVQDYPNPGDVTETQLFASDTFSNTHHDLRTGHNFRRGMGEGTGLSSGVEWTMSAQRSSASGALQAFSAPTGEFALPLDEEDPDNGKDPFSTDSYLKTFRLLGTTLRIRVYSPHDAEDPWQEYEITFPDADVLTPMLERANSTSVIQSNGVPECAWPVGLPQGDPGFEGSRFDRDGAVYNLSRRGDSILAMQNRSGDHRTESIRGGVINDFRPHARYDRTDILDPNLTGFPVVGHIPSLELNLAASRRASSLLFDNSTGVDAWGQASPEYWALMNGSLTSGTNPYGRSAPALPTQPGNPPAVQSIAEAFPPGEFSNGIGSVYDGGWLPKSDEGRAILGWGNDNGTFLHATPYFRTTNTRPADDHTLFAAEATLASPNRQLPSAVYFGSIPSGAPWRTLLFRPALPYHFGGTSHFGAATSPPDYYLLDLFHMPVVEPYAISEPFSTAGKVNMNARIVPFTSIVRNTALHAVLESTRVIAIPEAVARETGGGNFHITAVPAPVVQTRFPLDLDETMRGFTDRYDAATGPRVFLTAAEICTIPLVPEGSTHETLETFWSDKTPTGDNSLEQPYSHLLPRLTTKSNVYTVHYTVQTLKRTPGGNPTHWDEDKDQVLGEQRGSTTIERYIDPNDPDFSLPEYDFALLASETNPPTLGRFYKFRTVANQQFRP